MATKAMKAEMVPAAEAPGLVMVSGEGLADLATAIADSVGAPLVSRVEGELAKVNQYRTVTTPESYVSAVELRKTLKTLTTRIADDGADRVRVQVQMVVTGSKGQKIGIATETTIGTASVADFYDPLTTITDRLHKAVTTGRKALCDKIEAGRKLLESSALTWDSEQRRKKEEEERRQQAIREQQERTHQAQHWIAQLIKHGFQEATMLEILDNPIESVTAAEVETLRNLLMEKMQKEVEENEAADLAAAVKQALDLGMTDVAAELKGEAVKPVAVELPPPAPPARLMPPPPSVSQSTTPKVNGVGRRQVYDIKIVNPHVIPANWLLPPDGKLYDSEAYPRRRAAARRQGNQLRVPGVEVTSESKMTQR